MNLSRKENDRQSWLGLAQWGFLVLIVAFSVHTHRWALWQVHTSNVFVGFRAALLFLFDLPLLALLVVSGWYLVRDPQYRARINDTLNNILTLRLGGIWWLLLAIWITVSGLQADEPPLAHYGFFQTVILLAMAVIIAQMVREKAEGPLMWAFSLCATVQAVIAIAQVLHGDAVGLGWLGELKWDPQRLFGSGESTFRGYALTAHPNILAGYLLVALFAIGSLLSRRSLFSPFWFVAAILFGITLAGLLVTLSRAALLAALVAVATIAVLRRDQLTSISVPRVILLLVLILVVSIPAIALFGGTFVERNKGLKDLGGIMDRLTLGYDDTLKVFEKHPFLGAGEGNLMVQVGRNNASSPELELLLPAHNAFLVVLAELGIPGLVLFLLACGSVLVRLPAQSKRPEIIWTVAFLAWVIIMILDYYPWLDYRTRLITFLIIGIWWGYSLRAADELAAAERHQPATATTG